MYNPMSGGLSTIVVPVFVRLLDLVIFEHIFGLRCALKNSPKYVLKNVQKYTQK